MKHAVGITVIALGHSGAGLWVAKCDPCNWYGPRRSRAGEAQTDALEHSGTKELTIHETYRRRRFVASTEGMDEMFPGAK